jgi:hypothetical protein
MVPINMKDTLFAQLIGKEFQSWMFANGSKDQYQMELRHLRILSCIFEPQYVINFQSILLARKSNTI